MKKLIIALTAVFGILFSTQAETWVNLTEFKDAKFQAYLSSTYSKFLSTDKKQINVEQIYFVAITSMDKYGTIASLDGIKKLINLRALYLPGKASSNKTSSLTSIDVSGMRYLEIIDNGSKVGYSINANTHEPSNTAPTYDGKVNLASKLVTVIAEDCPKLRYVALAGCKKLKTVSLKGSTNIETYFIGSNDAMESLDVSELPKLTNTLKTKPSVPSVTSFSSPSYISSCYQAASTNKVNVEVPNFGVSYMTALKTLVLGNHPDWKGFSAQYDNVLESVNLTGCPNLEAIDILGSSVVSSTSTPYRGAIALTDVVLPEILPATKYFRLQQTSVRKIDLSALYDNALNVIVQGNYITEFPLNDFKKATEILLRNNCIYLLSQPNSVVLKYCFSGNRLTELPCPNVKPTLTWDSNPKDYNPQTRNVPEGTLVYRITDDPSFRNHIMYEDATNSQKKDYYAVSGGHIGDPDAGEDPCCFYFDYADADGVYFIHYQMGGTTTTAKDKSYTQVTLRHGLDEIDDYYLNPLQGGLIKTTEAHYAGKGTMNLDHSITWTSGAIRMRTDLASTASLGEFDPQIHTIDAPGLIYNPSATLFVDRGDVDISLVVELRPDHITAGHSAVVAVELADPNTGVFAPMEVNGTPVFYQVSPASPLRDRAPSNPTDGLGAGTTYDFVDSPEWHDGVKPVSSRFAIHMGSLLHSYSGTAAENAAARLVTYVRDSSEPADFETAARIASGNATPVADYHYLVRQPIGILSTPTGVDNINTDIENTNTSVRYFNLQGAEVTNPTPGAVYIRLAGGKASKITL